MEIEKKKKSFAIPPCQKHATSIESQMWLIYHFYMVSTEKNIGELMVIWEQFKQNRNIRLDLIESVNES
jgi:hypothetical protein